MLRLTRLTEAVTGSSGEPWKAKNVALAINGALQTKHRSDFNAIARELTEIMGRSSTAEALAAEYNKISSEMDREPDLFTIS